MNAKTSIYALIATSAVFSSAFAADLPTQKAPPAPPPPLAFSWTGIYAGASLGGSFGVNAGSGVTGGGQIGYNYQFSPLLIAGVEADIQGSSLRWGGRSIDYFGTVRGRVGFTPVIPQILLYGTGGFAYAQVRYAGGALTDNRTGWTAGGGLEWAFLPNWSARVEYLYTDISTQGLVANQFLNRRLGPTRYNTVRAALNYHFNVFPPAPILAAK